MVNGVITAAHQTAQNFASDSNPAGNGSVAGGSGAPPSTSAARRRQARAKLPKWAMPAAIVAVILLAWFIWEKTHANTDITANMITAPVALGSLTESVSATGSVEAQTGAQVNIGSQITGVIKRLYADVGSHVNKGQIIAVLDLPDLGDQLDESKAALADDQSKLQQTVTGVPMTDTQIREALATANAGVVAAQAKLADSVATANQTVAQTPTDIKKAQTALVADRAALVSAQATLVQTQTGANLQIATAREQLTQAQANAKNSSLNLGRQRDLLAKGFVAQSVVDQAVATDGVNQSLVSAAQENLTLTQQKVTADLQTAKDAVDQAKQNVLSAVAALAAARSELYTNQARLADVVNSRAAEAQARQAVQVAQANLAQVVQQTQLVQQARDTVTQAAATVAYNQVQLNKSYIRSPISGTVLQLAEQQGETIAAGLSAPTLIVVADLNRLEIDAYVDETDIGSIKLGQSAQVVVDAYPKYTFQGRVSKIASGSTIQNGVVTYDVTIFIKQDTRHMLKPDMTATATVITGQLQNVLVVPSVAVQVGVHGSTVSVVTKKNGQPAIISVPVRTGGTDGVNTQIISGLTEGQTIVVAGAPAGGSSGGHGPTSPFGPQQHGGGGGGAH